MHDDAVQRLVHLCDALDMVMSSETASQGTRRTLRDIRTEVQHAADGLRRFSRDLRPSWTNSGSRRPSNGSPRTRPPARPRRSRSASSAPRCD
ncbi:MAG: hypothetical protein FJZ92_00735 [Chloroflexi bacterium]|nr:hypothetical protein [Chloroflexota bacterium]